MNQHSRDNTEFSAAEKGSPSKLHPRYLSHQSKCAHLASDGLAGSLRQHFFGFLRDPEAVKSEILMAADSIRDAGHFHILKATPQSCFWGFFDRDLPSVLTIESGDIVYVEALTHRAGDAPDVMMDEGIAAIYSQITDRGPGGHLMTGPIKVTGAQPGDTLMVRILKTEPRLHYGSNLAARWGYLYDVFRKERITIYKLDFDAGLAYPEFGFDPPSDVLCDKPGLIYPPDPARQPFQAKVAVPMRPHFGIMGVAPAEGGRVNSVPPGAFGGNIDNWRLGAGATMYYPVFNEGANFFVGDPHMAQGDAELSGTAIEASMNAYLQIFVIHDFPVSNPILETDTHWITHAFDEDLNHAMRRSAEEMLDFLVNQRGISADEAYSLMSVAVDFGITQVVDTKRGCHAALPKELFMVDS